TELDPARIGACCGMAWCSFHLRRYDEGCAWAAKALQKYSNALYLLPLIMNAIRAGRKDDARNSVDRLLQMVPGFQLAHVLVNREGELDADAGRALRGAGLACPGNAGEAETGGVGPDPCGADFPADGPRSFKRAIFRKSPPKPRNAA